MKILSAKQIYQADRVTIKNRSISSTELMEQAAFKCFEWIKNNVFNKNKIIHVFCGIGNNGGDGLVIARKLNEANYHVNIFIVNFSNKRSNDFQINFNRLIEMGLKPVELNKTEKFPDINKNEIIIDAIFGVGITRVPQGFVKEIIQKINKTEATIISIDLPSGLFPESLVEDKSSVIKASHTLTFQNPKLGLLLVENGIFSENWSLLDIGLDKSFIASIKSNFEMIDQNMIRSIYKPRSKFSHKGDFGHSLIIGGSFGKIGAVILASRAALKIGSGLVTAYIPKCGYSVLQTANPEIMVEVDDENYLQYFNFKTDSKVIGIGIGMGTHLKTKNGFEKFLKENKKPLVIDADAINILAKHRNLLDLIPKNSILTPHPKEFERLVGKWGNDYEKLNMLRKFSSKYKCIVILKGMYTAVASNDKIYFNITGNAALATAGSGDVLTGIITGLIAQNYTPIHACILGVYIHGKTADIAINTNESSESFTASDSIHHISNVFNEITFNWHKF
jgi:ADP-dependent NAD(P)H-hydrate dehydratase / NAD(P)H-hydrate epimerase